MNKFENNSQLSLVKQLPQGLGNTLKRALHLLQCRDIIVIIASIVLEYFTWIYTWNIIFYI